ncbi:MAG: SRPBCC family protein, partial [Sphingomicrobium sp.]
MEFDNTLEVPLPPDETWKVLLDIRRIAACIPGAELTEVVDDTTYRGKVSVRLGPVALSLAGHAKLEEIDEAGLRVRVKTHGADPKGRGGADSVIDFRLEAAGEGTKVLIHSDVKLSGPIAQYGRGSGMIQSMASQLIAQFGDALKTQIASGTAAPVKPISGLTVLGKAAWDSVAGSSDRKD